MSLGDGLVCTDEDHRITVWNPGASAIFGYMPTEMIGRPFETLCAASADGEARPSMHDAARQALLVPGGAVVVEFEGRRKNGETFPVDLAASTGVSRVTLIKTGSDTHSWNMEQRFQDLTFQRNSTRLSLYSCR